MKLSDFKNKYINDIKEQAEKFRATPLTELPYHLYKLFDTNGDRLEYEKVYFERRCRLDVFAILYWIYKRQEDLELLEDVIWAICNEFTWALPAHLNGNSINNKVDENTIDLFASETAQSLSEIVNLFEQDLSEVIVYRCKNEIEQRIFRPLLEKKNQIGWIYTKNNWAAVCGGSIGIAALYLIKDKQKLDDILNVVLLALENYISGFSEDGACLEGLSYWTYGMSYYVAFSDLLLKKTDGAINLFKGDKFYNIALFQNKCYFLGGRTVSFADGNSKDSFRMGLTIYLYNYFKNEGKDIELLPIENAATFHSDNCYRFNNIYRDLLWSDVLYNKNQQNENSINITKTIKSNNIDEEKAGYVENNKSIVDISKMIEVKNIDKQETISNKNNENKLDIREMIQLDNINKTKIYIFKDSQWIIFKDINQNGGAIKGGNNDEPHNHNDIGSFFIYKDGGELLADLGAGEYTKQYFSDKRYDILCNSSYGHNVPVINGVCQNAGKKYSAQNFKVSKLSEKKADNVITISMDIEKAYDLYELKKLTRQISIDITRPIKRDCLNIDKENFANSDGNDKLYGCKIYLYDKYEFDVLPKKVEEHFISRQLPIITREKIIIKTEFGKIGYIYYDVDKLKVNIEKHIHMNHDGKKEIVYIIIFSSIILSKTLDLQFEIIY